MHQDSTPITKQDVVVVKGAVDDAIAARPIWHLRALMRDYPDLGSQVDRLRSMRGKQVPDWPSWCLMPMGLWMHIADPGGTFNPVALMNAPRLSGYGTWRYTQGVYRIDPSLLDALTDTPLTGDLPSDSLLRLPQWSVYVVTPGMKHGAAPLHGFLAFLDWNPETKSADLCIIPDIDVPDFDHLQMATPIPIGKWSLPDAFARMASRGARALESDPDLAQKAGIGQQAIDWLGLPNPERYNQMAELFSPLVSILLYLCSEEPEIDPDREPGTSPHNPFPKRVKRGWRLFPPQHARVWHVGRGVGEQLRVDRLSWQGTGRTVRPHIRRGHWHGYWFGPRTGKRRFVYRWLPPMLVASPPEE